MIWNITWMTITCSVGANTIIQQFNPTIKQSTFIIEGNADNIIDKDSLINARQYQFYVEDNYKINTTLFLYTGFHYARFIQGKTQYGSLQPRLKLLWTLFQNIFFPVHFPG
ncbi:MAG: hypothetical protein IPJ13_01925 [Saprospiraceae bacterium]|nr:hypothetical protein [Saprospiraceae bacterium]